jgi:Flp pilus assembly CpaE family ATPase
MSNWQSTYQSSPNPQGKLHALGGSNPVNSESSSSYLDDQYPDSFGADVLSIALIGPNEDCRKAAARALTECQGCEIREFTSYPASLDDVPKLLEQQYDVIIMDLDSQPEYALELVENLCANGTSTVMVYSMKTDPELLVRCMRAGAREFLTLPFAQNTMAEALIRASARRPSTRPQKKTGGRLLAFLGAKGGDGVTTLACNFAVSLAQESKESTVLIDLNLPLGDAALNLGITAEYSTINALQNAARLDSSFLSGLLVKHDSGVSVLAAPGKFPNYDASDESIDKLIAVARQDFDNVVIDMGSRLDLMGTSLFKDGSTIYLVIQASIAGLRNSNRLIAQYFTTGIPKLEIVLNRFEHRTLGVAEDQITKALTRPAQWKIPNDYAAVRRMQTTAIPLALEDSPISRLIRQMARTACGLPATQDKKSGGFSLKSLSRTFASKISTPDESSSLMSLGLDPSEDKAGTTQDASEKSAYAPRGGARHAAETPSAPAETDYAAATRSETSEPGKPETRTYKGATYVKSADGEWHLLATPPSEEDSREEERHREEREREERLREEREEHERLIEERRREERSHEAVLHEVSPREEAPRQREREVPAVAWSTPAPITYGAALGTTQLRALASVPGKFDYTPAVGEVLPVGTHTLTVDFTPADTAAYTPMQATVLLVVEKAMPAIMWPAPATIAYGAELGATQLNAKASVPGKFIYTPAAGEVLPAGVQTLSATFVPADSVGYGEAKASVKLTVGKATPAIAWSKPAAIAYGTALSADQLKAKASIPGSFHYDPAAGEVLSAGVRELSVTFTPENTEDYDEAQATVALKVTRATPIIKWPTPASIAYGTALSADQLNATASVPGKFVYIPAAGAVLGAGTHTPLVTFTPTDSTNYNAVQAAVSLTVNKAASAITWPEPAPVVYGTALDASQLNAKATCPGTFVYDPPADTVLAAGTHTLAVTFTPTDTADCAAEHATVSLSVTKARPTAIAWHEPASISHGTPLGAAQLNATAELPGKFVYTPAAGEVLVTGTHTLSVIFTPSDANFPVAEDTVQLTVTKATPVVSWPKPAPIVYGTALSAAQLNATASVSGAFSYDPAVGEVLAAGKHELLATFTPKNTTDEATVQAAVSLTVSKATPIITWQAPFAISYGTPLSAAHLSATALVPGTFVYSPAAGTVLTAGKQKLSVTFIPTDTADYTTAQTTVLLEVEGLANLASLMPAMDDAEEEDRTETADVKNGEQQDSSTPKLQNKPETRTYKGATYVKGVDGQWYLEKK